ncbi:hypothetical protein Nepgr_020398 [Nepenthes gracilis]|uniref:Uncharacterized protein n=1 Tax=Nepenthes gracilis TaxID=150966 RepID=A0AAD3SY19_NEPGR|nr:hypothetical protein Nepgr_020398 [Nepenthes gracilis]
MAVSFVLMQFLMALGNGYDAPASTFAVGNFGVLRRAQVGGGLVFLQWVALCCDRRCRACAVSLLIPQHRLLPVDADVMWMAPAVPGLDAHFFGWSRSLLEFSSSVFIVFDLILKLSMLELPFLFFDGWQWDVGAAIC